MTAKVRSFNFIDTLSFEVEQSNYDFLKAVLRDENGSICSELHTTFLKEQPKITWKGLNELPYGVYTLELSQGEEEVRLKMVKRI